MKYAPGVLFSFVQRLKTRSGIVALVVLGLLASLFVAAPHQMQAATDSVTIDSVELSFQDNNSNGVVNAGDKLFVIVTVTNTDAIGNCDAGTEVYMDRDPFLSSHPLTFPSLSIENCDSSTGEIEATLSGYGAPGQGGVIEEGTLDVSAGDPSAVVTVYAGDDDDTVWDNSVTSDPVVDEVGDPAPVDIVPPTLSVEHIIVDDSACTGNLANNNGDSESGNGCKVGDTLTFRWDNSAGGDNNTDGISRVEVFVGDISSDFWVTLTDDNDDVFEYDYELPEGSVNNDSETFRFIAEDANGNLSETTSTDSALIDNVAPNFQTPRIKDVSGQRGVADTVSMGVTDDVLPFSADSETFDLTMNDAGLDCTGESASLESPGNSFDISVSCDGVGTLASDYTLTYSDTSVVLQDEMGNAISSGSIFLSSFTSDEIAPVITSYTYEDQDGNGKIDQIQVGFSEGVTVGDPDSIIRAEDFAFNPGDFSGSTLPASGLNYLQGSPYGSDSVTIPIEEASNIDTHDDSGFSLNAPETCNAGSFLNDTHGNQTDPCDFFQPDVSVIDGAAPVVASTNPVDGATEVDPSSEVTVDFSEEMLSGLSETAVTAVADGESLPISSMTWNDEVDQLTLDFGGSLPGGSVIEVGLNNPDLGGGGEEPGGDLLGSGYGEGWGCQEGAFIYDSCTLDCGDPANDMLNDVCAMPCDPENPSYPYCLGDPETDPDVVIGSYTMSAFTDPGGENNLDSATDDPDGDLEGTSFSFTTSGGESSSCSGIPGEMCVPAPGEVEVDETSCEVTSPNGGEELTPSGTHTVTWDTTDDVDNINLLYSTNDGDSYTRIQSGLTNDGTYEWTVPDINTDNAKVRIDCRGPGGAILYTDASDDVFTIGDPDEASFDVPSEEEEPAEEPVDIDAEPGDLIKLPNDGDPTTYGDTTVYVVGSEGLRHPFLNEPVYRTWYPDFDDIIIITEESMQSIELGDPVLVRPGTRWVKIQSDPKVYYVEPGSYLLRHIADEQTAQRLRGENWKNNIIDISPVFFNRFEIGDPITNDFLDENWPNGALVQSPDEPGIHYIDEGFLRPITSSEAMEANGFQERFVNVNDESSWMNLPLGYFITQLEDRLLIDQLTP